MVNVDFIINLLLNDKIVAVPTDTIYGFVGNPFSSISVEKLYKIKNREREKKLSIFLKNKEEIEKIAIIDEKTKYFIYEKLENNTIILNKKDENSFNLISNDNTIAIRIPNNELLLNILNKINFPLFATSVNMSNEKECKNYQEVYEKFNNIVDFIVDNSNNISSNIPSKIFKIVNDEIVRIR